MLDNRELATAPDLDLTPGPCVWCGEHVEEGREIVRATGPHDPCWQSDGGFGCDESPDTGPDGVGDHARPADLRRMWKEHGQMAELLRLFVEEGKGSKHVLITEARALLARLKGGA